MLVRRNVVLWKIAGLLFAASLGACQAVDGLDESADEDVAESDEAVCLSVDPARSLAVTDPAILSLFPLQDVLAQILATGGAPSAQTPLGLYQQWWDTQNDAAHGVTAGPHCTGTINGFPVDCPRQEGMLAATDPFAPGQDSYIPLALVNRFDLAPSSGAHCGEYRIVYGKSSGLGSLTDRNFLIFEARMPNPKPAAGLSGCKPVADFWAGLTQEPSAAVRGGLLHDFYFNGLPGFPPAVSFKHYAGSAASSGQIRTNQFMTSRPYFGGPPLGQPWELREFHTGSICASGPGGAGPCSVAILQQAVANDPQAALFDPGGGQAFKKDFVDNQVATLAANDLMSISMDIPSASNAGQSISQGPSDDYVLHATGAPFLNAIQTKLTAIGSPLSPQNILDRATTQSCGGCHQITNNRPLGGGLAWPASGTFVHISEARALSPALTGTFLPFRKTVLESCICGATCP